MFWKVHCWGIFLLAASFTIVHGVPIIEPRDLTKRDSNDELTVKFESENDSNNQATASPSNLENNIFTESEPVEKNTEKTLSLESEIESISDEKHTLRTPEAEQSDTAEFSPDAEQKTERPIVENPQENLNVVTDETLAAEIIHEEQHFKEQFNNHETATENVFESHPTALPEDKSDEPRAEQRSELPHSESEVRLDAQSLVEPVDREENLNEPKKELVVSEQKLEPEKKPVALEQKPEEPEKIPVSTKQKPEEPEKIPVPTKQKPEEPDKTSITSEQKPKEPEITAPEHKPKTPDTNSVSPEKNPKEPDPQPTFPPSSKLKATQNKFQSSAASDVPKITYSKRTKAKPGEELLIDCSVRNVDLRNLKHFNIGWSKLEKANDGNHLMKISSNEDILILSDRYEVVHPDETYQYSLKIKNLVEKDTGTYRCRVDFGDNQIIDADVPVVVETPAYFADYITKTVRVAEGDAISIDCRPGGTPTPEVYWQRVDKKRLKDGDVEFWRGNQFDLPKVHRSHKGRYICHADNRLSSPVTSEVIVEVDYQPSVEVKQKHYAASVYDNVRFSCEADALPTPTLSWVRNGEKIDPSANMLIETKSEGKNKVVLSLEILQVQVEDFSDYSCVAENQLGRKEETIRLEMKTPPSIVKQTKREKIYEFSENKRSRNALPIALECIGSGVPTPSYRWTKDGEPLVWQSDLRMSLENETGTLLLREPNMEDNGVYQCLAHNELGVAASDEIELKNHTMIEFIREEPGDVFYEAEIGRPFKFSCPKVVGYPKPELTWMRAKNVEGGVRADFIENERMVIDDEGSLWISHVATEDDTEINGFKYVCLATSELHPQDISLAKTITLKTIQPKDGNDNLEDDAVNIETFLMHSSPKQVHFQSNEKNKLWCIFGGEPVPEVIWRRLDGKPLKTGRYSVENNGQTLVFNNVLLEDAGLYECIGSNGIRNRKKFAINVGVSVVPKIENDLQTQPKLVHEGETAVFDCKVYDEKAANTRYDWYYNSRSIEIKKGSRRRLRGSQLFITSARVADIGNYACRAYNDLGYDYAQTTLNVIPKFGNIGGSSRNVDKHLSALRQDIDSLSKQVKNLKTAFESQNQDSLVDKIVAKLRSDF